MLASFVVARRRRDDANGVKWRRGLEAVALRPTVLLSFSELQADTDQLETYRRRKWIIMTKQVKKLRS